MNSSSEQTQVLIETYWNVKTIITQISPSTGSCINRNILECKDESNTTETAQRNNKY